MIQFLSGFRVPPLQRWDIKTGLFYHSFIRMADNETPERQNEKLLTENFLCESSSTTLVRMTVKNQLSRSQSFMVSQLQKTPKIQTQHLCINMRGQF